MRNFLKKLGRRVAGTYGRTAGKAAKKAASKAVRHERREWLENAQIDESIIDYIKTPIDFTPTSIAAPFPSPATFKKVLEMTMETPLDLLRKSFNKEEVKTILDAANGVDGAWDKIENTVLYSKLFDYYSDMGEIPYGVQKARTGDPYEWVSDRITSDFGE